MSDNMDKTSTASSDQSNKPPVPSAEVQEMLDFVHKCRRIVPDHVPEPPSHDLMDK